MKAKASKNLLTERMEGGGGEGKENRKESSRKQSRN